MNLICVKGNAWFKQGKSYPVLSETAYVMEVKSEGSLNPYIHKQKMSYAGTGGTAEFVWEKVA